MGKEYLTEKAIFSCPFGMRFKAVEMANTKAKYKGSRLLTEGAQLFPQGAMPCTAPPIPPGGPPPCTCTMAILMGGVEHRATGNLLTMSARALCPLRQQAITPKMSGSSRHIIYRAAHAAQAVAIGWPLLKSTASKSAAFAAKAKGVPLAAGKASHSAADKTALGAVETPAPKATKEPPLTFRPKMLCAHSSRNPACRTCAYRLDEDAVTVDNDSFVLRKNYNATKPHTDRYDRYFDDEVEPLGDNKPHRWRYAAHHLISGNQVFKKNEELVRLARFCGYDINAYANCIMLVGYPEDYPEAEHMKRVKAYDVMSEGRVQWHVGGHSYTFTEEEKAMIVKQIAIRNKLKLTTADIKNYAELVQEEMVKLEARLTAKKNNRVVCYDDEAAKVQFCRKLDGIAQRIKAKLAAFSDVGKPHHSFPFYVSKEAYRYTYALPRTGKVITVLKEETQLTLSLYRLEHFTEIIAVKDRSLLVKHKASKVIDLTHAAWQRDCILFCDNVAFFVYLADTPRDILPFAVDSTHRFPAAEEDTGADGQTYLEAHDTEILVWLRDNPQYGYVSPALMVEKRSEEVCLR